MIINNFKNKKQILDVVRILRRWKRINYGFHKDKCFANIVKEKIESYWIENIFICIYNREDNWKTVFSFNVHCKYSRKNEIVSAKKYIQDNKSSTYIVLTELLKQDFVSKKRFKDLFKWRPSNALATAIYELRLIGCFIWVTSDWQNYYWTKPDNITIWFNNVYSNYHKMKKTKKSFDEHREELRQEILKQQQEQREIKKPSLLDRLLIFLKLK